MTAPFIGIFLQVKRDGTFILSPKKEKKRREEREREEEEEGNAVLHLKAG